MESLASQLSDELYISIIKKKQPYDWFYGPGSYFLDIFVVSMFKTI